MNPKSRLKRLSTYTWLHRRERDMKLLELNHTVSSSLVHQVGRVCAACFGHDSLCDPYQGVSTSALWHLHNIIIRLWCSHTCLSLFGTVKSLFDCLFFRISIMMNEHSRATIAVNTVFPALSAVFIALRIRARQIKHSSLKLDDYIIVAALVSLALRRNLALTGSDRYLLLVNRYHLRTVGRCVHETRFLFSIPN